MQQLKAARGFSAATLTRLPQPVVRRAVRRLEYPDLPRLRAAFRLRQSRDEHGVVPPNALGRALRQLRSTRAKVAAKPRVAGIPSGRTVESQNSPVTAPNTRTATVLCGSVIRPTIAAALPK